NMYGRLARQVLRKRPTDRLLLLFRSERRLFDGFLSFLFLQIFQKKLELLDRAVELLRRASELHPFQLGELCLQLFDLKGLCTKLFILRFERSKLRENERFKRFNIVGQRISRHARKFAGRSPRTGWAQTSRVNA